MELYDVRRTKFVAAHTGALAALALSLDGKLLATASVRGTLVRIHSTTDGTRLRVCTAPLCSRRLHRRVVLQVQVPRGSLVTAGLGPLTSAGLVRVQ